MSKKDNIIVILRDDCIVIKDRINDKKYKITLSGREGIELKVGQMTFGIKDGSMKVLPGLCEDFIDNLRRLRLIELTTDPDTGLPLYEWR